MIKWVPAALALVVSMAAGAGLVGAHDEAPKPSVTGETMDSFRDADAGSQIDGNDVELEGTLEILHEDRTDGRGSYHHFLSTHDGKRFLVEGVQDGHDLLTGDRVRVRGSRSEKTIRLRQSSGKAFSDGASTKLGSSSTGLQVLAQAPLSNTFGQQKVVVLLVNFSNDQSQPTTVAYMKNQMALSDTFYQENSYQQTSLSFDVFGWYTLGLTGGYSNPTCPIWNIQKYADQAASAAGIDLSQYTKRMYLFPVINSCGFTGSSTVGGNPSITWFNGRPVIGNVNHELGHALGLYHSNGLNCHPNIISGSCSVQEYGDAFDTMGIGQGHFNAFQKFRLGWLGYNASPPITTVTTSGTFALPVYENASSDPLALRIPRGTTGQSFYVEFRRNVGQDTYLIHTGVFVHLGNDSDPDSSWLLDMTPSTIAFSTDAFLDVGKSFTDPVSGITITTLSVSSTSATVNVEIGSSCTRARPTVSASPPQSAAVQPATTVNYSISITNTDGVACAPSSFSLQAAVPAGWTKSYSASNVTISPGATASTTLQVTSPSVPPGSYTVVSTATNSVDSTLAGSASVIYTVAAALGGGLGGGTAGTLFDAFDRPDAATALGNGWVTVSGTLGVTSGQARSAATRMLHAAIQPTLWGATQTANAQFTSSNNNVGPRFGLFARYVDARTYYACYRNVGGASVLRIAKVVNGTETILKSASVPNPALGVPFTIGCQVTGITITASLGTTTISAIDAAVSTGATGFFMGYTPGSGVVSSQAADNFQATVQ